MTSVFNKVYRLRGIPEYLDRLGVAQLMSEFIPDGDERDVSVASLAFSCEPWARPRTKTATLSFKKLPGVINQDPAAGEWSLPDLALPKPLLLDDTFFGLSPLNDVPEHEHHYNCIVMSGLASHPMGSWQPHGKDKSYMWIRDTLPSLVQNVKFILYGYDSKLAKSKSFQTVPDIALSFIDILQQGGWAKPGPRNLLFIAHSLGGIVLKEALRMVADSDAMDELILTRTRGAIFFGAPSQGLDVSDLQTMLQGQPNKDALVRQISDKSSFVEILEEQFSGISHLKKMKMVWAYETETTPAVAMVNGKYKRCGPDSIFVSPISATGQRSILDPSSTMPINANHSDMVKFSQGSELIDRIAYKLQDILKDDTQKISEEAGGPAIDKTAAFHEYGRRARFLVDHVDPATDLEFWDIHSITKAIHAPERDDRLEQIDIAAGHSFTWAFEKSSVGLTSWLKNGEKLFWISGKPASGKSTFMKYIHNNPLTADYLCKWYRSANRVRATFFFHHRGTAIQRSLDGLYRGILSQVLEQAPQSFLAIQPILTDSYQTALQVNGLGSLALDLEDMVELFKITPDDRILRQSKKILCCEVPQKAFRTMVVEQTLFRGAVDDDNLRRVYLCQDDLLVKYNKGKAKKNNNLCLILEEMGMAWGNARQISLIKEWLEATDISTQLSKLKDILMARNLNDPRRLNDHYDEFRRLEGQVDEFMKMILRRFSARKDLRHHIETASWSVDQLNHTVLGVTSQQLIDLDLCLFIDAMDEHDGPPEFISQFIKDIASTQRSRTRLKILFSSRPWQPFIEAFRYIPSIQIHEFTKDDIEELCLKMILPDKPGSVDKPGSAEILQLVRDIVEQARGVFLWVKLVLNDLLENAARLTAPGHNTADLHAALMDILKSLPTDLEQYYKTIIERIPHTFRREAFCLLEVVSKSIEPIRLSEMSDILLCANVQNIKDIYQRSSRGRQIDAGHYTKEDLRTHSGGLVEITDDDQLQLLHQTLVEFVRLPEFKYLVLGKKYLIVKDNGFTLLSKYEAVRNAKCAAEGIEILVDETFSHYAQQAESTTGVSIYSSFTGVTWKAPPENKAFPNYMMDATYTTLEVAVASELRLLLQDTMKHISEERRSGLLFMILIHMIELELFNADSAMNMLQDMVNGGLQIRHLELLVLMDYISKNDMVNNMGFPLGTAMDFFQRAMTAFFEPRANIEVSMNTTIMAPTSSHFDELMLLHGHKGTVQLLHITTNSGITSYLVKKGADPNGMTSRNLTPLDCWVRSARDCQTCRHSQKIAAILLHCGGRLNISTRQQWECVAKPFRLNEPENIPFPGWLNGAPGADTPRRSKVKKWLRSFSRSGYNRRSTAL